MSKKNKIALNANNYFSKASEEALSIIERVLTQHGYSAGFNALIFFSCFFLKLIFARVDSKKQQVINHHLRDVLKISADDGAIMCNTIKAANIETQKDRDEALEKLITNMDGANIPASSLFYEVAQYTHSLGMTRDSLWKVDELMTFPPALVEEIEITLDELIDEKINSVISMGINMDFGSAELSFFVSALISTGLMIGYASVLYHQPLDEMIETAIKQVSETVSDKNNPNIDKLKISQLN